MRRLLLAAVLCGCASSGGAPSGDTTPRQATILMGGTSMSGPTPTIMGDRPVATSATIAASPADVWAAVKKVYVKLEIPLTVENPAAHQLGNDNFVKSHQLAGRAMTQFADCGSGMEGPKAASYRMYLSLLTNVFADGKGATVVQTTFVAMGQDIAGGSTDRIPCGTTGRFESLVLDQIKAAVARP